MVARTILVTGGAGYVGSHLCKFLAQSGFVPVTYDNLVHGRVDAVRWGPFEQGDITDAHRLKEVLEKYDISMVCHCAALIDVAASVRQPDDFYHVNSYGMTVLLRAMRAQNIRRLVFSSTCAVYGQPQTDHLDEHHPRQPVNPYGRSKLAAEYQIESACAAWGLEGVILRYFNAAGADPEGEIGEQHDPETHLIPLAIRTALGQQAVFDLFGHDYPTPDGTAIRDYVHVWDLAAAHIAALNLDMTRGACLALNLGTGRGYSVAEIIAAIARQTGRNVPIAPRPRRAGDVPILVANAARTHQILGWQPHQSALETIIADAWRWHSKA